MTFISEAQDKFRLVLSKLYTLFDADGSGVVDFTELSSGLSVLCGGSRDEKARAAFNLYDYNGDGVISLDEMTRFLLSMFKVMYEAEPGTQERLGGVSADTEPSKDPQRERGGSNISLHLAET